MTAKKDQALAPLDSGPVVQSDDEQPDMTMLERLMRDTSIDVGKVERFMALMERRELKLAEQKFTTAMALAQEEMGPVRADATNPETHSQYATYQALDRALRPVYVRHGFAPSFNTEPSDKPDEVLVVCELSHVGGHRREYRIPMPADGKGPKGGAVMSRTHATGSAISYGMRYLTKMIWNIPVETDDDGNRASAPTEAAERFKTLEPEVRESIQTAFNALQLTSGLRNQWIAKWFGGPNIVPSEAAERLLEAARDEYAKRKGVPRQKGAKANAKTSPSEDGQAPAEEGESW